MYWFEVALEVLNLEFDDDHFFLIEEIKSANMQGSKEAKTKEIISQVRKTYKNAIGMNAHFFFSKWYDIKLSRLTATLFQKCG